MRSDPMAIAFPARGRCRPWHLLTAIAVLVSACSTAERSNVEANGGASSAPRDAVGNTGVAGVGAPELGVDFELDRTLVVDGKPVALVDDPSNELMGRFSPRVVVSTDGSFVVYTAWREIVTDDPSKSWTDQGIEQGDSLGIPEVRIVNLADGSDTLFASGAYSSAVRADGAIAYSRGTTEDYRAGSTYPTDLVVGMAGTSQPSEVWSDQPGAWVAGAWAQDTLIAYRFDEAEDSEGWSLVALSAPGKVIDLGQNLALGGLSPDGSLALVVDQTVFASTAESGDEVSAAVVSVKDGSRLASLTVTEMRSAGVDSFLPGGDWNGNDIAIPGQPGVSLLRFDGGALVIRAAPSLKAGGFGLGSYDAQFKDDGSGLTIWAASPGDGTKGPGTTRTVTVSSLSCDLNGTKCAAGNAMDPLSAAPVRNPSRPSKGPR
jgi:hypothetical protein